MVQVAENPPMDTTQASDSVCFLSMALDLPWGQSQVSAADYALSSKHSPPPCSVLTGKHIVQWELFPRHLEIQLVSVTLLPRGKLHAGNADSPGDSRAKRQSDSGSQGLHWGT